MKLTFYISLALLAYYYGPDFIGWLQYAYHCRGGCAASIGG
jgi:hypothetical protein